MENHRIWIIGVSCSGKSTLAKEISEKLNIPMIEPDDIQWLPGWKMMDADEFYDKIDELTEQDNWIITGNHLPTFRLLWSKANIIIWLDYPFYIILWRALLRTFKRCLFKQKCCGENYETFWRALNPNESILVWVLKTYFLRKKHFSILFDRYKNSNKTLIRIKEVHFDIFACF